MPENTQGLDLSFVQIDKGGKDRKVKQSDVLDLSFLQKDEPANDAPLSGLTNKQVTPDSTLKSSSDSEESGFLSGLFKAFTGEDKETEATKKYPEFSSQAKIPITEPVKGFKTAIGLLTSFSPENRMKVIQEAFPKVKFFEDEKGNIVVDARDDGQGVGMLNSPGFSAEDARQLGFQIALFTPAGKAATGTASVLSNMARVGVASGATQVAQDLTNQATRGDDVSLSNVDKSDVALVAGGGAVFQGLFQGLSKVIPALRQTLKQYGVTNQIREEAKKIAVDLGIDPSTITDDVLRQFADDAAKGVDQKGAAALVGEREFGIPLTSGQRSLSDKALSFEDAARSGLKGDKAQSVVRGFEQTKQLPAVNSAAAKIQQDLGRGSQSVSKASQAGAAIKEGIQKAERTADAVVRESFDSVGEASLSPGSFQKLTQATRKAIDGLEFPRGKSLTGTNDALSELSKLEKSLGIVKKTVKGQTVFEPAKEITELTPVHLKQVEAVRKQLGQFIDAAANNADRRNLVTLKNAYDDFLDDAVTKALFDGDQKALDSLKQSRGLFREYAQKFRERTILTGSGRKIPDTEGKFIEKIVAGNPTDEEVINTLFGANGINKAGGQRLAQRFKEILGPESDEWGQVRQAAFRRLIKTNKVNGEEVISGQNTLKAISDAQEKAGSLLDEIFTKDEQNLLKRFALQVKRTQPDLVRSRENPSGTAQVAGKALADIVKRVGNLFAISGEPTLAITSTGVSTIKGVSSGAKARAAVRPFERIIANPNIVGGSTGAEASAIAN